jgi:hypothetical protein
MYNGHYIAVDTKNKLVFDDLRTGKAENINSSDIYTVVYKRRISNSYKNPLIELNKSRKLND